MEPTEIRLTIPAEPGYLRLARLAAADTGSRAGLDYEELEDLRIAVDELCYALTTENLAPQLTIVYALTPGAVEVRGTCDDRGAPLAPSELARTILAAVVDEYSLEVVGGQRQFRLKKRVPTS